MGHIRFYILLFCWFLVHLCAAETVYLSKDSVGWVSAEKIVSKEEFNPEYFSDTFISGQIQNYQKASGQRPELRQQKKHTAPRLRTEGLIDSGTVTGSDINIRTNPDLRSTVIIKARQNARLKIIGSKNGWYQVQIDESKQGWIYAGLVRIDQQSVEIPAQAKVGVGTGTLAYVRSGPDATTPVMCLAPGNTVLEITEDEGTWCAVKIDSLNRGWLFGSRLSRGAPAAPAVAAGEPRFKYINCDAMNFRAGPGTGYAKIGCDWFGKFYEVLGEENGWSRVVLGQNQTGWALSSFLSTEEEIAVLRVQKEQEAEPVVINVSVVAPGAGIVAVRDGPAFDCQRMGFAPQGDTLFVTQYFGDWLQVRSVNGGKGWIYGPMLRADPVSTDQFKDQPLPATIPANQEYQWGGQGPGGQVFSQATLARRNEQAVRVQEQQRLAAEQARLDSAKGAFTLEQQRSRDQLNAQVKQKENEVAQRIDAERRQRAMVIEEDQRRMALAEKEIDRKKQLLADEIAHKEKLWKLEQENWLNERKYAMERVQAQKEAELLQKQTALEKQKQEIQAISLDMEKKNLAAKQEMDRMRQALEEQIQRFEAAKKEAVALKEKEKSLEDEDFFFNDEETGQIERKMDNADTEKQKAEKAISGEKEGLAKQKAELELYQKVMEKRLQGEQEKLDDQKSKLAAEELRIQAEIERVRLEMEADKKKRTDEFNRTLQQEQAQNAARIQEALAKMERDAAALAGKQKAAEDSLRLLEKALKKDVEAERVRMDADLNRLAAEATSRYADQKQAFETEQARLTRELTAKDQALAQALEREKERLRQAAALGKQEEAAKLREMG